MTPNLPWPGAPDYRQPPASAPGPPAVTPVHTLDFPVDPGISCCTPDPLPLDPSRNLDIRHSGWQPRRDRVAQALRDTCQSVSRRLAYHDCGASYWIARDNDDPNHLKILSDYCHDRLCVPCALQRAAAIRGNLMPHLDPHPYRFITLTLRATPTPLKDQLDRLVKCFRRLRHRVFWTSHVDAGIAFLEITQNLNTGLWHPHLHIIASGKYMPHATLRDQWASVTGDSTIIRIKLIYDPESIVHYVTKYVTKPIPADVTRDPAALAEALVALKGQRVIIAFGAWAHLKLTAPLTDDGWQIIGHLNDIRLQAANGDPDSIAILAGIALLNVGASEREFYLLTRGPPAPDTPQE